MATKRLLKLPFETEFRVVGVFCRENDYRLSWLLNYKLNFDFKRTLDFGYFSSQTQQDTHHSVFIYIQETLQRSFFLFNNHSNEGSTIFKTPPGLDFLLLIKADDSRFNYAELLKSLRSVQQITAAYQLDDLLGKNKEAFMYDFEMYLAQELKM